MLLEHLTIEPAWLNRRLDVPARTSSRPKARLAALFLRRYCAKLLYELEFFQARRPDDDEGRYVELLADALKVPSDPRATSPTSTTAST